MAALSAGNLSTAQKAYADIAGTKTLTNASSPLGQIGQALQKGNIFAAQQAAKSWQAARSGQHPAVEPTAPAATSSTSGLGSLLDLTA